MKKFTINWLFGTMISLLVTKNVLAVTQEDWNILGVWVS